MREKTSQFWSDQALALAGTFVYCLGINLFVVPAGLYTSGLLGLCQLIRSILEEYLHLSFGTLDISGIIYYAANIPSLLLAWKYIGKKFVIRTLVFISWSVLLLWLIPIRLLVPGDILTASVLGGTVCGIGLGMALRAGATLGGADMIALIIIKKFKGFSVGAMNLVVNLLVYGGCMVLFDVSTAIYSIISAVMYALVVDRVHAQNIDVEVTVITKKDVKPLEETIFHTLGRGVTQLQGTGAYTQEGVSILLVALSQYEMQLLRQIVYNYDPQAFVVEKDHVKIYGNYEKKL